MGDENEFEYYCDACGKEVKEDDTVCPNCGAKLIDSEKDENIEYEYYCNTCGKKVKEEDSICPYCGAALDKVEEDDEEFVNPVVVRTFDMDIDAEVAVQHLKSSGIFAYVVSDGSGLMRPNLAFSTGAKIFVREVDLEAADEILKAMEI